MMGIHFLKISIMKRASLLNLGDCIPQPDVRKLIWWKYLDMLDREMVWIAHVSNKRMTNQEYSNLLLKCAKRGYLNLFIWINENKNVYWGDRLIDVLFNPLTGHETFRVITCYDLFNDFAIKTKQPNIMEWVAKNGCQCTWETSDLCEWEKCLEWKNHRHVRIDTQNL
jgi:hypothetical protein